jgi:ankyrin repeat protein
MAARRGNISVAKALLECGANIQARDSKGDSPLRRALNCRKKEMAAFLAAHSANVE